MTETTTQTARPPGYCWPELARPKARLVYFDLNHWISLAQAAVGHKEGRQFVGVLDACRTARSAGRVIFPLSATHYFEMSRIKDPAQRSDLAAVMEDLSGFRTLISIGVLRQIEVEMFFQEALGLSRKPPAELPLVATGVAWAFGKRLEWRLKRSTQNAPQALGSSVNQPRFEARTAAVSLEWERRALRGPSDAEIPKLRPYGWAPERAWESAEERALAEREQRDRLDADPRWRSGRLRDVVSTRELLRELKTATDESLQSRGRDFGDLRWTRSEARRFIDSMPSTDIAVTMKTMRHRNREFSWSVNDIHDIDALSVAVPYCDITVTEKHAHHVLTTAKVPQRAGVRLLRRLADLQDEL